MLPKEANDSSMIVDCGDYACWTFITVYSLVEAKYTIELVPNTFIIRLFLGKPF